MAELIEFNLRAKKPKPEVKMPVKAVGKVALVVGKTYKASNGRRMTILNSPDGAGAAYAAERDDGGIAYYTADGLYCGQEYDSNFPWHLVEEVVPILTLPLVLGKTYVDGYGITIIPCQVSLKDPNIMLCSKEDGQSLFKYHRLTGKRLKAEPVGVNCHIVKDA